MRKSLWLTALLLVVSLCLPMIAYGAAATVTNPNIKTPIGTRPPTDVRKINIEEPPYNFSGYVRDQSGRPLSDASVSLSLAGGGSWHTITLSDGRYSFEKTLPAGNYTLKVGKSNSDYIDQTSTFTLNRSMTKDVTLAFVTYNLSGRVLDALGNGVAAATVTLGSLTGTSGGDGSFSIDKIRRGAYPITVEKTGYIKYSSSLNVNGNIRQNYTLTTASQTYTLKGYVRDPAGGGVTGAVVSLVSVPLPGSASQKWHGIVGADGAYSISGVAQVKVTASVFENQTQFSQSYSGLGPNQQMFDIYGNMTRDFTIALAGTVTLSGKVHDAVSGSPLPNATVTVGGKSAVTKADGSYLISGIKTSVQTGPSTMTQTLFTVTITHAGYNKLDKQVYIKGNTTSDFGLTPAGN